MPMEPYHERKNSGILSFAVKWVKLENMLSETSQKEKDKYWMFSLICGNWKTPKLNRIPLSRGWEGDAKIKEHVGSQVIKSVIWQNLWGFPICKSLVVSYMQSGTVWLLTFQFGCCLFLSLSQFIWIDILEQCSMGLDQWKHCKCCDAFSIDQGFTISRTILAVQVMLGHYLGWISNWRKNY